MDFFTAIANKANKTNTGTSLQKGRSAFSGFGQILKNGASALKGQTKASSFSQMLNNAASSQKGQTKASSFSQMLNNATSPQKGQAKASSFSQMLNNAASPQKGQAEAFSLSPILNSGPSSQKSKGTASIIGQVFNTGASPLKGQVNAFEFGKILNEAMGSKRSNQSRQTLKLAQSALPDSFKKQVGLGMMASGPSGSSTDSITIGAALMASKSPVETLKTIFDGLGEERKHLKLDKEALSDLGQILADSGFDDKTINDFIAKITAGDLSLDNIFFNLEQMDLNAIGIEPGLTVAEDSLPALGQFLSSLGASTEMVNKVLSGYQNGGKITASSLRQAFKPGESESLAPCLMKDGEVADMASMLKSMGVDDHSIKTLASIIRQNNGQMSLNNFLDFIEKMEKSPANPVTGQEASLIKNILENLTRDQQLAKTPVFNEILTKLQALGDREIDDEFKQMSPALQALRGGISAQSQVAEISGQNGQGSQKEQQENREQQYRQVLNAAAVKGEFSLAAAVEATQAFVSYGGQESLARQISQKVAYNHRKGIHRLKMNLNPAHLGQLNIELKVKNGELTAHIRAANRETYTALTDEIDSLKSALAECGINISNLVVSIDDQTTGKREFADLGLTREDRTTSTNETPGSNRESASSSRPGELDRVI